MVINKSLVGLLSALTLASCTSSNAPSAPAPTPAAPTESTTPQGGVTKTQYLSYKSPAGDDTMSVSVTTKDGVVTAVSATPEATNPISLQLQKAFADNVSGKVVGKSVKNLKVDTISGASLTTKAFNDFLATVQ